MTYQSPLANPDAQINKLNGLARNAITIDEGIARGARQAAEFANQYASEFQLVSDLAVNTKQFNEVKPLHKVWTGTLQNTRDASSALSAWFQRFDQVFLSMVPDIASAGDRDEVVQELKSFLDETPLKGYDLEKTQGVKKVFEEIINLATVEAEHVIKELETTRDLKNTVETLTKELHAATAGIGQVRKGLNDYAVKLVNRH